MSKPKNPVELPNKLSALLRLAVSDSRKVAGLQTRKLAMGTWHSPVVTSRRRVCLVCMAGAVMDQTLKIPPWRGATPSSTDFKGRLLAIDAMRSGNLREAAWWLSGGGEPLPVPDVIGRFGAIIKDGWSERLDRASWSTYLKAAAMLEAEGL